MCDKKQDFIKIIQRCVIIALCFLFEIIPIHSYKKMVYRLRAQLIFEYLDDTVYKKLGNTCALIRRFDGINSLK